MDHDLAPFELDDQGEPLDRNPKRRRLHSPETFGPFDSGVPNQPASFTYTYSTQSCWETVHIEQDKSCHGEYIAEHQVERVVGWGNGGSHSYIPDQPTAFDEMGGSSGTQAVSVEHSNTALIGGNAAEGASVSLDVNNPHRRTVCFGMVSHFLSRHIQLKIDEIQVIGIEAEISAVPCPLPSTKAPVHFLSADTFSLDTLPDVQGRVYKSYVQPLKALLEEQSLELQSYCVIDASQQRFTKDIATSGQGVRCTISVIIYGSEDLFEDIGDFLQQHDLFLQDPRGCNRNVLYRNPHRLSSTDPAICPYTLELDQPEPEGQLEDIEATNDILEALNTEEELKEAEQPSGVQTPLAQ